MTGYASLSRVAIAHAQPSSTSGDCARVSTGRGGETVCFLGDVAGHGPEAAALARDLEARVARLAGILPCGALLGALNAAVESTWPTDRFVSAVCFAYDAWTGRGAVAVAGQLPPFIKRMGATYPLEVVAGPALGLLPHQRYPQSEFFLAPGDVLVAVTDGVTDALATPRDLLGVDAAARVVDRSPPESNQICASLLEIAGAQGFRDDATILVAAHRPFEMGLAYPWQQVSAGGAP